MKLKAGILRKRLIIFSVIILISGLIAFSYYFFYFEVPIERWDQIKPISSNEYFLKKDGKNLIIESQIAGISFKVPYGFRVEKDEDRGYISLLSEQAQGGLFLTSGCRIIVETKFLKTSLGSIREVLENTHKAWPSKNEYSFLKINGISALLNTTQMPDLKQFGIGVHLPLRKVFKSKLYYFGLSSPFSEKQECEDIFREFLKTIFIYNL